MDNSFLHSKRLLLVDDEQELLKMVTDILKDALRGVGTLFRRVAQVAQQ